MSYIVDKKTWFIAHNGVDIFHYAVVDAGRALDTGQPYLEEFYTEEEWLERLIELGLDIQNIVNDAD